ncbi:energy transducer TonB [Aquimarina aggregata]|uniref:energy transducer TonB n=1 Tax=Aquimarina aggregata TaxID=1642818 RepID=UPI00248FF956|nr:energy transducer TonB [Aquimarina aggregata]
MSNKHDANVRKSTLVNFQIGLIASLLFTYFMFEVYTAVPVLDKQEPIVEVDDSNVWDGVFQEYQEPKPKEVAVKQTKPPVEPQEFKIIENTTVIEKMTTEFKNVHPVETSAPVAPGEIDDVDEPDPVEVPFSAVEFVPIFPGCEKLATNKERATCFSKKVGKIVARKFNTGLGERYGLSGLQKIYTQFDVNQEGEVTNIRVRASHPKLEEEARRVINLFPQMTPGKQRDRNVTVKYQLPIVFKIQG